jgi:chromosome segregation ATPase
MADEIQAPETFTKEQVEKMIQARVGSTKEEAEKYKTAAEEAARELESLTPKLQLNAKEKEEYKKRFDDLRKQTMTAEQLKQEELERAKKEAQENHKKLEDKANFWEKKYQSTSINYAITDAALRNNAFSAQQLNAILQPITHMVETLDSEGNPTGDFKPMATLEVLDKKSNEPKPLLMSVEDAVKHLKEKPEFANLFKGNGTGGIGGSNLSNTSGAVKDNGAELTYEQYKAARKAGKL